MTSKTITFFGSGQLALESLKFLSDIFDIDLVITKSSKNHSINPVINFAKTNNLKLILADNLQQLEDQLLKQKVSSQLGILIDYGVIISQNIINKFHYGILNSHFSILPNLRGPDPITYALLNGQLSTGVSLMSIVEKLDEGPLLDWQEIEIQKDITNEKLSDQLLKISNQLIEKNVLKTNWSEWIWHDQTITKKEVSYSKKITKSDGLINFNLTAQQIDRQIRAFHHWPKSYTYLKNHLIIIDEVKIIDLNGPKGSFFNYNGKLIVYCHKQALEIKKIKPANKKMMSGSDFINGYRHLLS